MVDFSALQTALAYLGSLELWVLVPVGAFYGLVMGAIPGVNSALAIAAVLPITFYLEPFPAIMLLCAVYTGAVSGGSIGAILLNMPGTTSSIITAIDGFPMTEKGKVYNAIGIAGVSSAIGTFFSYILYMVFLLPLMSVIRYLGPADRFMLALAALVLVILLMRDQDPFKALYAAVFGLFLGLLGITPKGLSRLQDLNISVLFDGLPSTAALIGLVAMSSLIAMVGQDTIAGSAAPDEKVGVRTFGSIIVKGMSPFRKLKSWLIALLNILIGFFVGIVPGAGASIGSFLGYGVTRQLFDKEKTFGTGDENGVIASEVANNATEGGALTILMALGIPGSTSAALLLNAFLMQGISLGPIWLTRSLDFAYGMSLSNMVVAFMIPVLMALFMAIGGGKLLKVPLPYLIPVLIIMSAVGLYGVYHSFVSILIAWIVAFVGYLMKINGYPLISMALGFILASTLDNELYHTLILYNGNFASLIFRPVSLIILVVIAVTLIFKFRASRKAAASK